MQNAKDFNKAQLSQDAPMNISMSVSHLNLSKSQPQAVSKVVLIGKANALLDPRDHAFSVREQEDISRVKESSNDSAVVPIHSAGNSTFHVTANRY